MARRDRTPTRDETDRMKKDKERSRYMKVKQEIKFKNAMEALHWEAYQLGIDTPQKYDKENLYRLIEQKKKQNPNWQRGIWVSPRQTPKTAAMRMDVKVPEFKGVIGVFDAKKALIDSIVRPLQRPDLYPLGWERCILLYGPPGTGKTHLVAETSKEIKAHFIEEDAATIQSCWIGEASKNVGDLFNNARRMLDESPRPVIIFIDEIDSLFRSMKNGEKDYNMEMRNQFKKELDGVRDKGKKLRLYLIGSTNKPWELDDAFMRRFQKRIYIKLPDKDERMELFKLYTEKLNLSSSLDYVPIVEACEGYSGSDIMDICRDAHQVTLDRLFESEYAMQGSPCAITEEDFLSVIKRRNKTVTADQLIEFENWSKEYQAS